MLITDRNMNPERWAEIAGSFAVERAENESGSARRCVSHTRLNPRHSNSACELVKNNVANNNAANLPSPNQHESLCNVLNKKAPKCPEDYNHLIGILKDVIKEKVEESKTQKDEILSLREEIERLKEANGETRDAFSQTNCTEKGNKKKLQSESRKNGNELVKNDAGMKLGQGTQRSGEQDEKCENDCEEDGALKPLSEIILEKIDIIEKRMDVFLSFIENHFPKSSFAKFHFNKLQKDEPPVVSIKSNKKPWNKPPALQPRSTCSSSLRGTYSRANSNNNNNKVCPRESSDSIERCSRTREITGSEPNQESELFYRGHLTNESNRDTHPDSVTEQRLRLLEALVTQLKQKFMRLVIMHRKNLMQQRRM